MIFYARVSHEKESRYVSYLRFDKKEGKFETRWFRQEPWRARLELKTDENYRLSQ